MPKPKTNGPPLVRVNERDLQKERAKVIGRHVQLVPGSERVDRLTKWFRRPQLSGTITNSWMGAGIWMYEVKIHEQPPQYSGYTGHTHLQLRGNEVSIGGECLYHTCRP